MKMDFGWTTSDGRRVSQRIEGTDDGVVIRGDMKPLAEPGNTPAGCGMVHRWCFLRWHGVPFPKRLLLKKRWPFVGVRDLPGCGCLVKGRALWSAIKIVWRA